MKFIKISKLKIVSCICTWHRRFRFVTNCLGTKNALNLGLGGDLSPCLPPPPWSTPMAARLLFGLCPHDHVTTALQQLHWLPVYYWIQYILCLLMQSISHQHCPAYISQWFGLSLPLPTVRVSGLPHPQRTCTSYQELVRNLGSVRSQFQDPW